jgi:alpha-ribazole phosphatase/probable phosphoglycerate mutase
MKTKLIFLRHAETQKNQNLNAAFWTLSEIGKKQAQEVNKLVVFNYVDIIYVSEETKTKLTVEPLAERLHKKVVTLANFNEVTRGDKFLTKEKFEIEKVKQLTNLNYNAFGGESCDEALVRFKKGVDQVVKSHEAETILIVTHGTILNLYFADLLTVQNELPDRWHKTSFCAYGIVENNKVSKDIITE